jgi:hypothetical protein
MRRKLEVVAFFVLGAVAVFAMSVDQRELRVVDSVAIVLMLLLLGVRFYRVRLRSRAIYGAGEVAVAIGTLIFVMIKGHSAPTGGGWQNFPTTYLGLLGGLYIFVRGLDNIDQGLANSGWLRRLWNGAIRDEAATRSRSLPPITRPDS